MNKFLKDKMYGEQAEKVMCDLLGGTLNTVKGDDDGIDFTVCNGYFNVDVKAYAPPLYGTGYTKCFIETATLSAVKGIQRPGWLYKDDKTDFYCLVKDFRTWEEGAEVKAMWSQVYIIKKEYLQMLVSTHDYDNYMKKNEDGSKVWGVLVPYEDIKNLSSILIPVNKDNEQEWLI